MANSALQLTSLDFDTLKNNLKSFLSSQSTFKDYNFEGSNMNVLMDIMSYNSYLNTFYLNMVASEMFMDSAQKMDSVVSHAKELNYLPRSTTSSQAKLSFTISTIGTNSPFTIQKGTKFSGSNSNGTFTFVTAENFNFASANTLLNVVDLPVYEGKYVTDSFVVDSSNTNQKFVLSNPSIDTSSLRVTVIENGSNGSSETAFSLASTLYNLTGNSSVYFIQASHNNQYEIVFGDGVFGRKPTNLATVSASYRVSAGTDADGITSFICEQDLGALNGGRATTSDIVVSSPSYGSANSETIEEIRFHAPRYFATQQRAISVDDYSSLILTEFGGSVSDINVYGGETLTPKQYGTVVLCIKPNGSTILSNNLRTAIVNYITPFIAIPNRVIISNPDYLYCAINTSVQYDVTKTTKSVNDLSGIILQTIKQFSINHIEQFNSDFRYSKFVAHIDECDSSIVSNDTQIQIVKRLTPILNLPFSTVFSFNNSADLEATDPLIGYNPYVAFGDEPIITSSAFTYFDGTVTYPFCYIRDDNTGNLVVYSDIHNVFTVLKTIGTIDYATGDVVISSLVVSDYSNYISLYMKPKNKDIVVSKDKILIIDPSDIHINLIEPLV